MLTFQIPWYNIAFTIICGLGTITNTINIIVFNSSKLRDKVYKYLLASSACELIYLVINGIGSSYVCGASCSKYSNTLQSTIFSLYFITYLSGVVALFSILIEIFLSFQRYTTLINKPFLPNASVIWILLFLLFFAALVNVPILLSFHIVQFKDSDQFYYYTLTEFGLSGASY